MLIRNEKIFFPLLKQSVGKLDQVLTKFNDIGGLFEYSTLAGGIGDKPYASITGMLRSARYYCFADEYHEMLLDCCDHYALMTRSWITHEGQVSKFATLVLNEDDMDAIVFMKLRLSHLENPKMMI